MDRPALKIEDAFEDPRTLLWLLVTAEALTPRGEPGPLARPWVPTRRRRGQRPRRPVRDRTRAGD